MFDTVSGTLGLTGAADTVLILKRQAGAVTLSVRGRDIEETEMAVQFDKGTCRWSILGSAAEVHRSAERKRVIEALRKTGGPLPPKDIQFMAELRNRNATDVLLGKMLRDEEIVRADRGRYALPPNLSEDLPRTDSGQIARQIEKTLPPTPRTDRTDRQIGDQVSVLKCKMEMPNLSDNLSGDLSDAPDHGNLSDLSDLSAPSIQAPASDLWADLDIPPYLRRERLGPPAISTGPDDDLGDLQ